MATYTGLDKRLAYLFANGGGGGGSCKVISGYYHDGSFYEDQSYTQIITGSEDSLYIDLDTTTLYLFDGTDYVEVQGGGGGAVSDGTAGVRIAVNIPASGSVTYSFDDLGIVKSGYYIVGMASAHAESSGGWKWIGVLSYSGSYTSSYPSSYIKSIDSYYTDVSMQEQAKTLTFRNTSNNWGMPYALEVLPLHPKIEIPKHTYSTTEQVVGTWIDGKPLYEKTISFTTGNSGTYNQYAHGIVDVETIWIDYGKSFVDKGTSPAKSFTGVTPYTPNPASFQMVAQATELNIDYRVAADMENKDCYITLRYTKTSD